MVVFTVYVMFAIFNCCGQKLLYADFANKIYHMSLVMRKPFCLHMRKQRRRCEADQRLRFRYTDSTIPLLSNLPSVEFILKFSADD